MTHLDPTPRAPAPDSEWSFRRLLETLPAAAYICDANGLITYFNRYAAQLWGREPKLNDPADRFCGSMKLLDIDGSPIAHERCWMALVLRENKPYMGQEIVVERSDGTRVSVLAHASPIHDEEGKLTGAVNVLVDISDRKAADESRAQLAAIVESSNDAIISKTLEGQVISWNAGAERLFGYTAEEAIGQPIAFLIPRERHDEERMILQRLARGERVEHYETVRLTKSGQPIDVSLTVSPVRDNQGRIVAASKVARDITRRKQAEAAMVALKDELAVQLADMRRLHQMSMSLSTALELPPILEEVLRTAAAIQGTNYGLICLCDPQQNRLYIGASMGFESNFLAATESVPPGEGACGVCFQQGKSIIVEDTETDPSYAAYRTLARQAGFRAVHATPLRSRTGKVVGVLSTHFARPHRPSDREQWLVDLCARQAADCIENARLYSELREADRRKDEFLATLAHELRNPLAPISNALYLLQMSEGLDPAVETVREIMSRQINQLVRLVDDLMDVSRIARGKIQLRKERVELTSIIKNAVETARPLIDEAGHQLALTLPTEAITLSADPVRLAQAVTNLLNNAAKYTDPGGQIWLTATRDGGEAVISVRDNGVGIPPQALQRIFRMFAQSDRTLGRAQGGLGIGLALTRSFIDMHGGRIAAHSDGPGKGSEFVVRLPLAAVEAVDRPVPERKARMALQPRRILVVDDAPASLYTLGKLLEKMGQYVRTTQDPTSALEDVLVERPDVLITDIAMPGMDGLELARRVRRDPKLREVVLVALTGYGQDSDRRRAMEAGFDHYLVKPVSLSDLEELLASLPPLKSAVAEVDARL